MSFFLITLIESIWSSSSDIIAVFCCYINILEEAHLQNCMCRLRDSGWRVVPTHHTIALVIYYHNQSLSISFYLSLSLTHVIKISETLQLQEDNMMHFYNTNHFEIMWYNILYYSVQCSHKFVLGLWLITIYIWLDSDWPTSDDTRLQYSNFSVHFATIAILTYW